MNTQQPIDIVSAIFRGADEHDWSTIEQAMAPSVCLDYSSLSGNPAAVLPSSQIIDSWKNFLPGFDKTHHQLSDFGLEEKGPEIIVRFAGKADHFIGKECWTVEGHYEAMLSKQEEQWRVTGLTFTLTQQRGNTSLPMKATERINNQKI